MKSIVITMALLCALFSTNAEAKRYKPRPKPPVLTPSFLGAYQGDIGPRPHRWCGWFMQADTGVTSKATGRNLNMAREWRHVGSATTAGIGAIVVWAHHVGRIVGGSPGKWVVRSGNDGRAVRERVRSVAGAIAFRAL